MGRIKDVEQIRQDIIEAAGQLFAASGYDGVTVREIGSKSRTRASAVNYHFTDKARLYDEVLRAAISYYNLGVKHTVDDPRLSPLENFTNRVEALMAIYVPMDKSAHTWQTRLLAREAYVSGSRFERLIESMFAPQVDAMAESLKRATPVKLSENQWQVTAMTLLGQMDALSRFPRLVERVHPGMLTDPKERRKVAQQIAITTVGGLVALAQRPNV
jgi:TetR/AcrR family transcriptional regulator, regulator of cefoperazone and chloramphenicol sensitivity